MGFPNVKNPYMVNLNNQFHYQIIIMQNHALIMLIIIIIFYHPQNFIYII